jgi:hypothetical protein
LKHSNEIFIVVNDAFFIFKTLLIITWVIRMFAIYISRFEQYQFDLDALLNKSF